MKRGVSKKEKRVKQGIFVFLLLAVMIYFVVTKDTQWNRFAFNFLDTKNYLNIVQGITNTLLISLSGFAIGCLVGVGITLVQGIQSQRVGWLILKSLSQWYVSLFRGTPTAVQLLIIYYIIFASYTGSPVGVAILAFGLNSGAYVSEIMRGGLQSVSKGQMEAGRSLGLPYSRVMFRIILPQAIRNALPSLFNELITLVKETSIAGFIGAVDLTLAFRKIANATYDYEMVYLVMGLLYFFLILLITKLLARFEERVRSHD